MTFFDTRHSRPSFWRRVVSLVTQTPETLSEWHWHGEQMRRQLPDGTFAVREPTEYELFDKVERQAW